MGVETKTTRILIFPHLTAQIDVPILVLANKQDLPGAKEAKDIASFLGLNDLGPSHLWHVQPTCAVIGDGLEEGLDILYNMILKRRNK